MLLYLLLFLLLLFPPLISPAPATINMTLFGDARMFNDSTISLTKQSNCSSTSQHSSSFSVGRALYSTPFRFLDPKTNSTASFSSTFSFSITPSSPSCDFGDGLAFLITSNAESFIHFDGYLGLPYSFSTYDNNAHQDAYFAVEFDTNFDAALGDINGNHVGINVGSVISFASVDVSSTKGVNLKGRKELTAWIEYWHPMRVVRVWVVGIGGFSLLNKPSTPPLIVAHVDLSKQFKEFMHVGFSASNGRGSAAHLVRQWRFKTTLLSNPPSPVPVLDTMVPLDVSDCLMCSLNESGSKTRRGAFQDLNQRLRSRSFGLKGLIAVVVSAFFVMAVSGYFLFRTKFSSTGTGIKLEKGGGVGVDRVPERMTLPEIKSATMSFSKKRVIGEGASSTVYKGLLPSGELVAVKRFNHVNRVDSFTNSFVNEFATMAEFLKHNNLVQLHGWCCEANELILVYEYMPNGSLEKLLHKNACSVNVLSWEKRVRIILGVASALAYLHEECERQIIHRDVKACNIMLDADFNPKLGDFGLAEVYEHRTVNRQATLPAGTMGYLAPEYVYSGVPTEKTDVYSFGVVILEVATGRRPVDDNGTVVVDKVWELWEKGKVIEAADAKLRGRFKGTEMERMLIVGLLCTHPNHQNRPCVKEAAKLIKGEAPLPYLPKKKPTLRMKNLMVDDDPNDISGLGGNDSSPGLDDGYMTPKTHFS